MSKQFILSIKPSQMKNLPDLPYQVVRFGISKSIVQSANTLFRNEEEGI